MTLTGTLPVLRVSGDRKVTNLVSPNGKTALGKNAFGLPSGKAFSCPGATSFCEKICYAGKLEKVYKGVSDILMHNWNALKDADIVEQTMMLHNMIQEFVIENERLRSKGKTPTNDFRIHWDGDFFSRNYAQAWANVITAFPQVNFWAYTRSFDSNLNVVDILADIPNLVLYLSADPVNINLANEVARNYPGVFIATVADTFAEARETILDETRKGYNCPENDRRVPLISEKGSACIRCGVCVAGRGDVFFAVKKK
jgi:hypothetical protein